MYVWLLKKLGKKNIQKMNNWFPHLNQCAQLTGRFVLAVADAKYPALVQDLNTWYLSNLAPIDLYKIVTKHPEIFILTTTKGL